MQVCECVSYQFRCLFSDVLSRNFALSNVRTVTDGAVILIAKLAGRRSSGSGVKNHLKRAEIIGLAIILTQHRLSPR